jgi:hypothetical protein
MREMRETRVREKKKENLFLIDGLEP